MLSKLVKKLEQRASNKNKSRWAILVKKISAMESALQSLSDEQLQERALICRQKSAAQFLTQWGGSVETLIKKSATDSLLLETFALVREVMKRVLGLRPYDVQLMGAIALHEGILPQMNTGEGKTLVIPMVAIYSAFCGMPPHVITVNEYLAQRDAQALEPVYQFVGLTVGVLKEGQSTQERQVQYKKDIVYGVNHEFGFDYLRDHMILDIKERRQRGLYFALIDEIDSILIDEARTPLIITEQDDTDIHWYPICYPIVAKLHPDDFEIEERQHRVWFTELGLRKIELALLHLGVIEKGHSLYLPEYQKLYAIFQACLQARALYEKDKNYIVQEGAVIIIDEATGRLMKERRWGHGVHQALESKEAVPVLPETKVMGQITYQNFFKQYVRLNGLTGSAISQKEEFLEIYGLHCEAIAPNKPMIRKDYPDIVYRTKAEKMQAIVALVEQEHRRGRPILIGTASVEESEVLSKMLDSKGLKHEVLNAKNHQREAQIIAKAGVPWSITVSTNMAGRGTDILLGGDVHSLEEQIFDEKLKQATAKVGAIDKQSALRLRKECAKEAYGVWKKQNEQVRLIGGLLVIGSSRHDSVRVDTQLRGRAGRQGDPGESQFIVSLEDDLFRIYAQSGLLNMIDKMNLMPLGSALQAPIIVRGLDKAQRSVEAHHYSIRKQLLLFDSVGAKQREVIYAWRNEVLEERLNFEQLSEMLFGFFLDDYLETLIAPHSIEEQWNVKDIEMGLWQHFRLPLDVAGFLEKNSDQGVSEAVVRVWLGECIKKHWHEQLCANPKSMEWVYRMVLQNLDKHWQWHLESLAGLREGIHLRSISQKDPKLEYAKEAYAMFKCMLYELGMSVIEEVLTQVEKTSSVGVSVSIH